MNGFRRLIQYFESLAIRRGEVVGAKFFPRVWLNLLFKYKSWPRIILNYLHPKRGKLIPCDLRNGIRIFIRSGTTDIGTLNENYILHPYKDLLDRIRPGSVVLDVGAQIGIFSLLAAKQAANVQVFSIEPFRDNYLLLRKNVHANDFKDRITTINLGLAGSPGLRILFLHETNTGGHSMFLPSKNKIQIKTVSLVNILEDYKITHCDFLKLDCEGAEYEILFNTPPAYLQKINFIAMEYHNLPLTKAGEDFHLKQFLQDQGFTVKIIRNVNVIMLAFRHR